MCVSGEISPVLKVLQMGSQFSLETILAPVESGSSFASLFHSEIIVFSVG